MKNVIKTSDAPLSEVEKYTAAFAKQKALPKKEVMKLRPGTWVEIKWKDAANSLAMLLDKPTNEAGDVSLHCFEPEGTGRNWHATHRQVVAVHGVIAVPDMNKQ